MVRLESILGKLFANDKQIVVLDDTAENGGIESGSNADGSYIKYPDGTMIQWGANKTVGENETNSNNLFGSTAGSTIRFDANVNFPLTFIDTPVVVCAPRSNFLISVNALGASDTGFFVRTHLTNTADVTSSRIDYIAIGRWK